MLASDITQPYWFSRSVQDVVRYIGDPSQQAGLVPESGHAWCRQQQQLAVWKYADPTESYSKILRIPFTQQGKSHVQVLPQSTSSAVTVLLGTQGGQLALWLDAYRTMSPITHTIRDPAAAGADGVAITSIRAVALDSGAGPGFVAVAGAQDGSLYLLQVSWEQPLVPPGVLCRHLIILPTWLAKAAQPPVWA